MPVGDGRRPADRPPRRPGLRHLRGGQGHPLPRGRGRRHRRRAGRPRHPLGPRQPAPPPRHPRRPRRAAQSVPGVEEAEITEILDHHHIGSIETTVPVRATFDPVGSTATLVVERFRQNGMEPSRATRSCCSAPCSRTPSSSTRRPRPPATTPSSSTSSARSASTPQAFGREMFAATADLSGVGAEEVVTRDAKHYEVERRPDALHRPDRDGRHPGPRPPRGAHAAMDAVRERRDYVCFALMVTDIAAQGTCLLVSGEEAASSARSATAPPTASSTSRRHEPQEAARPAPAARSSKPAWRYGCQVAGMVGEASWMKTWEWGTRGFMRGCMLIWCGSRSPLRRLQGAQEATMLSHVEPPPLERGMTWSTVSAVRAPQYWHSHWSRAKTARRVILRRCGSRGTRTYWTQPDHVRARERAAAPSAARCRRARGPRPSA